MESLEMRELMTIPCSDWMDKCSLEALTISSDLRPSSRCSFAKD